MRRKKRRKNFNLLFYVLHFHFYTSTIFTHLLILNIVIISTYLKYIFLSFTFAFVLKFFRMCYVSDGPFDQIVIQNAIRLGWCTPFKHDATVLLVHTVVGHGARNYSKINRF